MSIPLRIRSVFRRRSDRRGGAAVRQGKEVVITEVACDLWKFPGKGRVGHLIWTSFMTINKTLEPSALLCL
jgi:hypothetical protein